MPLFSRRPPADTVHPVYAFWDWWRREGHSVSPHTASPMLDELNRRVMAINDELAWHFSAGSQSEHRLTVSAGGQAEFRPLAERWLRAAPAADGTWEFRAGQEPQPDALSSTIEIGDERVDLSRTGFRVRPDLDRMRVDVGVYHPQFRDVPEAARMQISFLVLDWLLGEDDVERWLGEIEALTVAPPTSSEGSVLLDAVAALREQRDRAEWVLAQWQGPDGHPSLASFRRGSAGSTTRSLIST